MQTLLLLLSLFSSAACSQLSLQPATAAVGHEGLALSSTVAW